MKFIKENSYTIFKMFVNQIGMTFFGLVLSFATQAHPKLFLATSIFAVLFYMVLLYTMTWDCGYEDSQAILAERKPFVRLKGFYMSLCANALNFILGIMAVVGFYAAASYAYYSSSGVVTEVIADAIGKAPAAPAWAVSVFGIGKVISVLLNGMYSGIIGTWFTYSPWIYLIIIIPSLIVCTVAYIMGVKGKHLTKLVGGKQSKE